MRPDWRHQLWRWLTRHLKDGEIPPRRFLLARALLFPRQSLLWWLQQDNGHDPLSLSYRHGGVAIPLRFLDAIARAADGESFVIVKCTQWPEPCITWRPVPPPLLIQPKD